jgi:acetyl-CoA carboxylase biotin carboxylase subunit
MVAYQPGLEKGYVGYRLAGEALILAFSMEQKRVPSPREIRRILVANRGEIALRIMRTAREMGIETVAIHSEVDADAPFVKFADRAISIGPAPSAQSYLVIDRVVQAALDSGADAIHPGYGFLSENARFAAAVRAAGLIFIGPSEEAIETMGSKLAAKETVAMRGVPLVPGTKEAIHDPQAARAVAREIGYPLLIKASAGGGGKGMRIVHEEAELEEQFHRAVSEAVNAFGDGSVFIERFVNSPRHIEVQVLADQHGQVIHLFERECSIQRRHQKVVEEAPSSVLTPALRDAMGQCAVEVARSCGYEGAGTVEFLLDDQLRFYFLEMNTRLQVEHPVTEEITGVDLVREQIRIAAGHPLSYQQSDLSIQGHALEVRVYAERPRAGFLPDTGTLTRYRPPVGPGIRVDDGVEEGSEVSIYYDPMLAKLVVKAPTRAAAIDRMIRAIDAYEVVGVETTLGFCRFAVDHPAFRSGQFDTHFVAQYFQVDSLDREPSIDEGALAQLAAGLASRHRPDTSAPSTLTSPREAAGTSPWWQRRTTL